MLHNKVAGLIDNAERPFGVPDAGLAQVLDGESKRPVGMAFLVSPTLALTCAHVVNVALGRKRDDTSPPPAGATVMLGFPHADDIPRPDGAVLPDRTSKIRRFNPPGRLPTSDIALLELDDPAPAEVGETVLAEICNVALDGDELGVSGPPGDPRFVVQVDARFGGKVNPSWTQLDSVTAGDAFVRGGFSGGRVWSFPHDATIGMVVAMHLGEDQKRAFMIPTSAIRRLIPDIPSEVRRIGPYFCATWAVFVSFFFLMMLTHFLGERIGGYPTTLALGGGNTIVTGFFGMNILAVLMPMVLGMTIRFSSGYSEHPWWMRLPRFGRFARPAQPTASRTAALLTLALLVIAPLYVQGHFLHMFHTRGDIYIYPGQFGYTADELEKEGQRCYRSSVHYCTHPDAGPFSVVTPKPGAQGGYINNAYHYGKRDLAPPSSVTIFPVIQPLLIWGAYIASIALSGLLAVRVFSAPRRFGAKIDRKPP
ncbi:MULTISPECIES: trypsin-like peptidase domain-containing protein [Mesorhizobium]|uniref:trypsin-like peptidase domain-containing protein n=1 Tax=Mesorhizobium TaxID=68287 RepID=UPI0012E0CAF3|nr:MULTISPECIES: trypsin-like peptidase domain-containing protein [Mesorhizobium]MUT27352.1 hypothetical protein [Mesorhizobium japonicum]